MRLTQVLGFVCSLTLLGITSQADVIYNFTNFEGPGSGSLAGTGTNMNGIANGGAAVGTAIGNDGAFNNFVRNADGTFTSLNIDNSTTAMAFGINSHGDVVGSNAGAAFILPKGGSPEALAAVGTGSTALGINDNGNIVGQYKVGTEMPGFFLLSSSSSTPVRIDAPSGSDTVFAQGVNDSGLIVGFYVGTDGNDHGFDSPIQLAHSGEITGTAITDPTIPNVTGEPGATFVFSQILGINDNGIAVGYYGDSTTSQHGFLYNTITGQYTFLDDPSEAFDNGVEVTQITGINNAGEITGFYSDANGIFHGFVASSEVVPEPSSFALMGLGLLAVCLMERRKRNSEIR